MCYLIGMLSAFIGGVMLLIALLGVVLVLFGIAELPRENLTLLMMWCVFGFHVMTAGIFIVIISPPDGAR